MAPFLNYIIAGIANGFIYSLIGLGFVLIYKCSGVLNFAQGSIAILCAYILYLLATQLGLPTVAAVLITLIFSGLLGLVIQRYILNRLIGEPILAIILLTLALGELFRGIMYVAWGSDILAAPMLFPVGSIDIMNVTQVSYSHAAFVATTLILIAGFAVFYNRAKMGLAMKCTSDDTIVATSLGIRVPTVLAISWIIACLTAAVAGILVTNIMGINYNLAEIGIKGMIVALVGGLQSLPGIIIVGPLLGIIEFLASGYIDPIMLANTRDLVPYFILLLVLLVRPYGVFGWQRIERI